MSLAIGAGQVLTVAAGSAIGAVLRWICGLAMNQLVPNLPLGTLLVNGLGGLLAGAAMVGFESGGSSALRLFLVTGLLGGFTTFSAFSAESLGLLQQGLYGAALLHAAAHVLGALACAALGFMLARLWWPAA